jgi:predicted HTH domain antitoxin
MSEVRESVNVEYPADVRTALRETKEEFARDLLMLAAVKLYELGKISSGKAAALAGTDRASFLLGLGKYRVSVFNYTPEELEREAAEARAVWGRALQG